MISRKWESRNLWMIVFWNQLKLLRFQNDDIAIFVTDEELSAFSYEKTVKAKIVSIDLKTLTQTYLCPVCSSPVSINNAAVRCEKCNNTSAQSQCKSKAVVKMVILNESGR